jgi:hypothetical protein
MEEVVIQPNTLLGEVFIEMALKQYIDAKKEIGNSDEYVREMSEYEKAILSVIFRYEAQILEVDTILDDIDIILEKAPNQPHLLFQQKQLYEKSNEINTIIQALFDFLIVEIMRITPLAGNIQFRKGFKICKIQPVYNLTYFAQFMIPGEA